MLHSHFKNRSSLIFQMLQSGKYHLIFFNQHRNKNYWHQKSSSKVALSHFCTGPDPLLFQVCSPFCHISRRFWIFLFLVIFSVFQKNRFLGILGPPSYGIGALSASVERCFVSHMRDFSKSLAPICQIFNMLLFLTAVKEEQTRYNCSNITQILIRAFFSNT